MPSVRYRQEIVVTFETTWRGNGKRIRYAARPLLGFVQKKQKKISVYSRLSLSLALFYAFHSLEAVEEKACIELQEGSLISKDRLFFFKIALWKGWCDDWFAVEDYTRVALRIYIYIL